MSTTIKPNIYTLQIPLVNEDGETTGKFMSIYDVEKMTFDALNDFNTKYAAYLRCTPGLGNRKGDTGNAAISAIMDNNAKPGGGAYYSGKEGCAGTIPTAEEVNSAKDKLVEMVDVFEQLIKGLENKDFYNKAGYSYVNLDEYTANLNHIKETYKYIKEKRNEYDNKLDFLNKQDTDKNATPWDAAIQKEQEMMFVGTTGAILASALIYYIFSKL